MNLPRLTNKSALITGGASGVGRATALRFGQEGIEAICLFDRDAKRLDQVATELAMLVPHVTTYVGDVGNVQDCRTATQLAQHATGYLDILVSNAAIDEEGGFLDLTIEEWDRVLDINLRSSFVLGQLAARSMVASGSGGAILYTASISGVGASQGDVHYGVSKAGVISLAKSMAIELVDHRIRVNSVSPGPLDTPLSLALLGSEEALQRAREHWPMVPMKRLGRPEEIAATFAFLASDDGGYITGQNIIVDGGLTANTYSIPESAFDR